MKALAKKFESPQSVAPTTVLWLSRISPPGEAVVKLPSTVIAVEVDLMQLMNWQLLNNCHRSMHPLPVPRMPSTVADDVMKGNVQLMN